MKKEILQKGVVLPLIIGFALAVAFFIFLHETDLIKPISDGAQVAYHDQLGADSVAVKRDKISEYSTNDCIGTITAGEDYLVRYNADYSNMISSFSFVDGQEFGKGVTYLCANSTLADAVKKTKFCTYDGPFGRHSYQYRESKEYYGVYSAIEDKQDYPLGLVVIYQPKQGNGISSTYKALIFEEVE